MTSIASDQDGSRLLAQALCSLRTPEEAEGFLKALCTPREKSELARRLSVAQLLDQGCTYAQVQEATGASSATVSRVSRALNSEDSGYAPVLRRLT